MQVRIAVINALKWLLRNITVPLMMITPIDTNNSDWVKMAGL
jgi:hypothetical protein